MALGPLHAKNQLSPRILRRRKAPYYNEKQDDAAQHAEGKCLRTNAETYKAPKSEMTREALVWSNRLSVALIWP